MDAPPKLAPVKNQRLALALNLALPGAGQWYLGQRWLGAGLALIFAVSLALGLKLILGGVGRYLRVVSEGRILDPGVLETLATVFHLPWLLAATAVGVIVQIASVALIYLSRSRTHNPS